MSAIRNEVTLSQEVDSQVHARSRWRRLFREFSGYGVVSLIALGADTAILKSLVDYAHVHYLPASVVGFICGAAVAYVLSTRFVFTQSRSKGGATEFLFFAALGLVGLLVNSIVLSIAISGIGVGLLTAKGLAAGCTFLTNFALRRRFVFAS